jgi:hypothetical protein
MAQPDIIEIRIPGRQGYQGLTGGLPTEAVDAVANTNIVLSGLQTVDGVALLAGQKCGTVAQNNHVENGSFIVSAGAWARSSTFNAPTNVVQGSRLLATGGALYKGGEWYVTTLAPNPGVAALDFAPIQGSVAWVLALPVSDPGSFGAPYMDGGIVAYSR